MWQRTSKFVDSISSKASLGQIVFASGVMSIGGVTAWLAHITAWVNSYGPIAWAVAFFAGSFLATGLFYLSQVARARFIQNRYASANFQKGAASPLNKKYEKVRIDMGQFYNPYYIEYEDYVFHDCQIWGPTNLILMGGTLKDIVFRHCQIVVTKDNVKMYGVTAFKNPVFVGGEMCNLTLLMNMATYNDMKRNDPQIIEHIKAINVGV